MKTATAIQFARARGWRITPDWMETKFSHDELYAFYKQIRNCLRKYNPESIISHAIIALNKAMNGGPEVWRRYQPWNILLIIKWTLEEADPVSHRRPLAKLDDLHKVLNTLHEMGGHVRMPTEYEHVYFFMRQLAFQQFWLQGSANGAAIVRQQLLFCDLPDNHPFQRNFIRLTGISCADFTLLSLMLTTMFMTDSKRLAVRRENFSNLNPKLISSSLDIFLSKISNDISGLHRVLTNAKPRQSIMDQLISQTPLIDYPLLKVAPNYFCYYATLLYRSLESYIYRTLKADNPAEFQSKFGLIFEQYVKDCLSDIKISFREEADLDRLLGGAGKCIDFLIVEDDNNILIDAKGVEASQLCRVSHEPRIVFQSVKNSVQKAIKQGMDTMRRMIAARADKPDFFGKSKSFLIIVTYDSLNLGSNTEFVRMFGQKVIDDLQAEFGNPLPIPIENIFWLDIDEFERLLARVYEKQTTITSALLHAQKNDLDPKTHKFHFIQHLESLSPQKKGLPRSQSALDKFFDKSVALFSQTN